MASEVHVADLPIDLQQDAVKEGMELIKSRFTSNDVSIFFGGSYFATEAGSGEHGKASEEAHDPEQPWNDLNIRRAMTKAINRVELGDFLYAGYWQPMYIDGFHPTLEGWNDEWVERYDEEYGYDPDAARDLIEAAGYSTDRKEGPKGPIKVTANSYVSPGESRVATDHRVHHPVLEQDWHRSQASGPGRLRGCQPLPRAHHAEPGLAQHHHLLPDRVLRQHRVHQPTA